jgi:hypothetical protein
MRRTSVVGGGRASKCGCTSCAIERADRGVELLSLQHAEARRYLDALKRFRWQWDLEGLKKSSEGSESTAR